MFSTELNRSFTEVLNATLHRHPIIGDSEDVKCKSKSGRYKSFQIAIMGILTIPLALVKMSINICRCAHRCFTAHSNLTGITVMGDDLPIFIISPITSVVFIIRGLFGLIHPAAALRSVNPNHVN